MFPVKKRVPRLPSGRTRRAAPGERWQAAAPAQGRCRLQCRQVVLLPSGLWEERRDGVSRAGGAASRGRVLPGGTRSVRGQCGMLDAPPRAVTSPPGPPGVLRSVGEWARGMGPLLTSPRPALRLWSPETRSAAAGPGGPDRGPCARADARGQGVVRGTEAGSWPRVGPWPTARSRLFPPLPPRSWPVGFVSSARAACPQGGPSPSAVSLKQRPDPHPAPRLHRPDTCAGFSLGQPHNVADRWSHRPELLYPLRN